jgi:hypothetical protein
MFSGEAVYCLRRFRELIGDMAESGPVIAMAPPQATLRARVSRA